VISAFHDLYSSPAPLPIHLALINCFPPQSAMKKTIQKQKMPFGPVFWELILFLLPFRKEQIKQKSVI